MQENSLILSIVTILLKNNDALERRLRSVDEEFWVEMNSGYVENIIVLSEDLNYLQNTKGRKYFYTPPKGIYNAMNKDLKYSKGQWIWFLNDRDAACKNLKLIEASKTAKCDIIKVSVNCISNNGSIKEVFGRYTSPHPGTIYRSGVLKSIGGFREDFKIIFDHIVFDELSLRGAEKCKLNKLIANSYKNSINSSREGKCLNKKKSFKHFLEENVFFKGVL